MCGVSARRRSISAAAALAPLKAALVDARQQLVQRAVVDVALPLVAGQPHAHAIELVLRRVGVDLVAADRSRRGETHDICGVTFRLV